MRLKEVYRNIDAFIEVNEEKGFLQITWLQHPSSESFRHILSLALDHALEKQLFLWLCDMRKLLYLEIRDQNWLVREIYPALEPTKQHLLAYVVSKEDLELQTSFRIQDLVEANSQLSKMVLIEIFFAKALAQEWLFNAIPSAG